MNPILVIRIITRPGKPHTVAVCRKDNQRFYHNASTASFHRIARLATSSIVQRSAEECRYVYRYV